MRVWRDRTKSFSCSKAFLLLRTDRAKSSGEKVVRVGGGVALILRRPAWPVSTACTANVASKTDLSLETKRTNVANGAPPLPVFRREGGGTSLDIPLAVSYGDFATPSNFNGFKYYDR